MSLDPPAVAADRYRAAILCFMDFFDTPDHRQDIVTELRRIAEHGEGTESPFYKACVSVLEDFDGRVKFLHFVHRDEQDC